MLPPQAVNLCPRGVPHRVCLQPRLASFHEVLEPRIVDVRADALSAAQLTHRRLAPEPLQHDSHLLFGSVTSVSSPVSPAARTDEFRRSPPPPPPRLMNASAACLAPSFGR